MGMDQWKPLPAIVPIHLPVFLAGCWFGTFFSIYWECHHPN